MMMINLKFKICFEKLMEEENLCFGFIWKLCFREND
jgi:hypothetical protein